MERGQREPDEAVAKRVGKEGGLFLVHVEGETWINPLTHAQGTAGELEQAWLAETGKGMQD